MTPDNAPPHSAADLPAGTGHDASWMAAMRGPDGGREVPADAGMAGPSAGGPSPGDIQPELPPVRPQARSDLALALAALRSRLSTRDRRRAPGGPERGMPAWLARLLPSAHAVLAVAAAPNEAALAVRVSGGRAGRLSIDLAESTPADALRAWRARGLANKARTVLVLGTGDRHATTLDRPDVESRELAQAARWPLADTLETDPGQLAVMTMPLPSISDAARPQMLAWAANRDLLKLRRERLATANLKVAATEVIDGALLGLAEIYRDEPDGVVALLSYGHDVSVALMRQGELCAARTITLTTPREEIQAHAEELALQLQRMSDHFERQATRFALRKLVLVAPSLPPAGREILAASSTLAVEWFQPERFFGGSEVAVARCGAEDGMLALALLAMVELRGIGRTHVATVGGFGDARAAAPRRDRSLMLAGAALGFGVAGLGAHAALLYRQLDGLDRQRHQLAEALAAKAVPAGPTPEMLAQLRQQAERAEAEAAASRPASVGLSPPEWFDRIDRLGVPDLSMSRVDIDRSGSVLIEGEARSPALIDRLVHDMNGQDWAATVPLQMIEIKQAATGGPRLHFRVLASSKKGPGNPGERSASTAAITTAVNSALGPPAREAGPEGARQP